MSQSALVHGSVAPGFEGVAEQFRRNFNTRGELGAACAVYWKGNKVVDLWGGYRDLARRIPWEEDTLVLVFSTTKGVSGLAIALAHSRGCLDYEEKVATYWPEFAQQGKEKITIRQLLSHQAGLCAIDEPLDSAKLSDLDGLARILARQKPAWEPGKFHGYHGLSLGWYEGELVRRVDPQHRSLGRFFAEEIAGPLGLEFYIGLPASVPADRIATIKGFQPWQMLLHINTMPLPMVIGYLSPGSLTRAALGNPRLSNPADLNTPAYWAVEFPAGTGVGQVRAIARAYGEFAAGGQELGLGRATVAALESPAEPPSRGTLDQVLRMPTAFSLGFLKPSPAFPFGSSSRSYGTMGAGGSFGFADPEAVIGFAYAPNKMGFCLWDDPREKALRDAVYRSLASMKEEPDLAQSAESEFGLTPIPSAGR